jgi:predicted nucleotidyltransferase
MREVLFKTIHGSRLYGLSHAGSDNDYYTVVTKKSYSGKGQGKARYAKQTIVDSEDSMVVDFGTWVEMCKSGVPQALEAMFSPLALHDDIADFRTSFRVGTGVYERYFRTIKSFALAEDDTIKKRRHALRLALNLAEIGRTGRFNPTLSAADAAYITDRANRPHSDVYGEAMCLAW